VVVEQVAFGLTSNFNFFKWEVSLGRMPEQVDTLPRSALQPYGQGAHVVCTNHLEDCAALSTLCASLTWINRRKLRYTSICLISMISSSK